MEGRAEVVEPTYSTVEDHRQRGHGRHLFQMYCRNCHGMDGRGDGPRASLFDPAPRDFTRGVFKFRSTPSGSLPTRGDLFRTISNGVHGTGMVSFADLPERDRWALVAYVRGFSERFDSEPEAAPVPIPPAPADLDSNDRIERGRKRFASLGCASCHGAAGRGDGPSAKTLDHAVPDLALQPLKRGDAPASIFQTLVTGLDGTPMPSFVDAAEPGELWDVVAFVRAIPREAKPDPELEQLVSAYIRAQYAQAKHTIVGGCGCQAGRLSRTLEEARTRLEQVRKR